MMKIYWTVMYHVPIAEIFIMGYCLYRFAKSFMENKKCAFCVGVTYSITMLMLYVIPIHFDKIVAYIIGILTAFIVMCRTDRRNYEQKIFISVTFFSMRGLTSAMAEILYDKLYIT